MYRRLCIYKCNYKWKYFLHCVFTSVNSLPYFRKILIFLTDFRRIIA
uniref:Uncharacterized protein n=1 Tax=Microviridae sp. ctNWS1 TaxID=2826733 RepID=A0A8S5N451_9VIRU|nr:MAG TPA: hypothetical protein [Microviridae sp. ctNWS1]DAU62179.1 MAG TPA: hypothetical protein [Microviridae sp.]